MTSVKRQIFFDVIRTIYIALLFLLITIIVLKLFARTLVTTKLRQLRNVKKELLNEELKQPAGYSR